MKTASAALFTERERRAR